MKYGLLINGMLLGGAERVVYTLLKKLNEEVDIELICLQKKQEFNLNIPGLKITYLSNMAGDESGLVKMLMLPVLALRLVRHIRKSGITLLQSHLYRANYVNLMAKRFFTDYKAEIFLHGVPQEYYNKGLLGRINIFLINELFPKADRILTNSLGMQNSIKRFLPARSDIKVYYNQFAVNEIQKKADEKVTDFSFKKDIRYIISIGRLYKTKRQLDILKAFSKLCAENADIELIFLGDGKEKQLLQNYAIRSGLQNKIHFLGNVTNPYKYLKRSYISVLASESESFGNVIVESMACGTPVIAADCDYGPREILGRAKHKGKLLEGYSAEEFGYLYSVGDIGALQKALKEFLLNKDVYTIYKKRMQNVVANFDIDNHQNFSNYFF